MSKENQVNINYAAFEKKLPSIIIHHRGEFALMKDGEIVDYFDTARDTYSAGIRLFGEDNFSIQEVVETPVDLGFFSYAMS